MNSIFAALRFSGGAQKQTRVKQPVTPILLYHCFDAADPPKKWAVTTRVFEEQLQWLRDNRYSVVPLRPIVEGLRGDKPPMAPFSVALTVDDGDRSVFTEMFPVVLRHRAPVTLFVYPAAISHSPDALTWEELKIMVRSGLIDVQFHTVSHPHFKRERRRRGRAEYQALVEYELGDTKTTIETRLGLTVDMLAWPFGVYDRTLEHAAAKAGFQVAFAVTTGPLRKNSLFAVPRIMVHNRHRGARLGARIAPERFGYAASARIFFGSALGHAASAAGVFAVLARLLAAKSPF